jgi:hypothetical protein
MNQQHRPVVEDFSRDAFFAALQSARGFHIGTRDERSEEQITIDCGYPGMELRLCPAAVSGYSPSEPAR